MDVFGLRERVVDAYYAALYGLTRDELRYIPDPADVYGPDCPSEILRVLKEKEIRQYGEYRTHRLVLEAWDRPGLEPRNRDGRYSTESRLEISDNKIVSNARIEATAIFKVSSKGW